MTFLLGSTRVESTVTLDAVSGRFLQSNEETIILGRPSQIDVFRESEPAYLTSIFTQPTFDRLLSLTKIPGRPFTEEADELQVLDMPLLLFESQRLAVLHFDAALHRFTAVLSMDLQAAGLPFLTIAPKLEVNEGSDLVTIATAEGSIAVLRIKREPTFSLSAPLTHQCAVPNLSSAPTWTMLEDVCFVGSENQKLVLLLRYAGDDGTVRQQLQMLQIGADGLRLVDTRNTEFEGNVTEHPSCRQMLCVWAGGILVLSSKSIKTVAIQHEIPAFQHHCTNGRDIVDDLEDWIPWRLRDPCVEVDPAMRDVAFCWQRKSSTLDVMLLCLGRCILRVSVKNSPIYNTSPMGGICAIAESTQIWNRHGIPAPPICLPSGAFLLRSGSQHVEVFMRHPATSSESETYKVNQLIGHIALLRDATTPGAKGQVYAISGEGHPGSPSALHVLNGCQVLDMLFKSPAEYEGVTGLWSIPIGPADITSALVIMSFASGSRAMTAGSTLSDVTEAIGLDADSQTLEGGSIAYLMAVQVTSKAVLLCSLQSLIVEGASTVPLSEDERPRKKSSPSDEDMDPSFSTSEESVSARLAHLDGAASSADSAAEPSEAFSSLHLEAVPQRRDRGIIWEPPGGATISCACVLEGYVLLTCPKLRSLTALALEDVSACRMSSSGKRKRGVPSHQLIQVAECGMRAELSCMHALVDTPEGLLCLVGTYEPAVELLLLQTQHSRGKGTCGQFQRLCRLQKETICPVLHSSGLPASAGLTDVPESVLLLKGATPHTQALVGWRSGLLSQISLMQPAETDRAIDKTAGCMSTCLNLTPQSTIAAPGASIVEDAACNWHMEVVCVRRFAAVPVRLVPLPSRMQARALAIGERLSLLSFSLGSGRLQLDLLDLVDQKHVSHAVPLIDLLPADSSNGRSERCSFMIVDEAASMRLMKLKQANPTHATTYPLDDVPKCIVRHEWSDAVAIILEHHCKRKDDTAHPPEEPTCSYMTLVAGRFQEDSAANACGFPDKQRVTCFAAMEFSFDHEDRMKRAYFAVGFEVLTRVNQGPRPPICGHIMLLGADAKGISSVANVLLPDCVHALCYFSVPDEEGSVIFNTLIAAVGKRLACFSCVKDAHRTRMEAQAWTATREEITSLSVSHAGIIAATGESQSVTLYTYSPESGFQVLCADPCSRNSVSCLNISLGEAEDPQSLVCLDADGGVYGLRYEQDERGLERNMRMDMHFHCRGCGVRVLEGSLSCFDEDEATATPIVCTAEGALVQLWTLSAGDYAVLAAVEAAMARSSLAAPLSGASHSAFRSAVEASAGGNRALAHSLAGGSMRAIDGDFLAQLAQLPDQEVQRILDSVDEQDVPDIHAGSVTETGALLARATSLPYVLDLLDRALSCDSVPEPWWVGRRD